MTGIQDTAEPHEFDIHATGETKAVEPAVPFAQELLPENGPIRQRLARWVTHEKNEAFARAAVNRIWALMAGRPLVEPVDDIPAHGPYPPALTLLAEDFAKHGHNLQRLIRAIAATKVYRLDSRAAADADDTDIGPKHYAAWAAFPITRLRPEQVVGSVQQAASLTTIDYESHILIRMGRAGGESAFVNRYGDPGVDELEATSGTIPQRLLMLNGNLVQERTKVSLITSAATRIAKLAPDDATAVEVAYLAILTRRPTPEEQEHFVAQLAGKQGDDRSPVLTDLYWALINSTEFSWNH